ncbi:hypothetical protein RRG08_037514 [Elysia crispata]|uniref:Calponin-homology (CH) domain-containing protein n=1 Tax=Elysia crispata TaxID=231223 RepID=A0AAE1A3M3_9GAST|nr:hypothetical protein RRG08_037514 [Elysia crispata]KAK3780576.1 hypothetical protein RRG08_037514 [Elysia crispata]
MNVANRSRQQALSSRNLGEWLQIQRNTFTNWVNESLRSRGIVIDDVRTDLSDGVTLVALVEALIKDRVPGAVPRPSNQYQKLQNITVALDALRKDGVKLINIDSSDIVAAELKLVLALVWALVHRYQVGGMALTQHKAWLLAWLHAVIPDCSVTNFTTDWNDGIALHALLDFCKPGLSSYWRTMNRLHRLENCQSAMKLARQNFNIPLVLRPENLASPDLDELSAITYLSYFTRVGGPGYDATLRKVAPRTLPVVVENFTGDWQDGQALVNLVRSAGGTVQTVDQTDKVDLIQAALDAGHQQLGIEPILSAKEITAQHSQHLGMMTYSSQYFRYSNVLPYEGYHLTEPKSPVANHVGYNGINGGPKDHVTVIRTNYNNRNSLKHLDNNHNSNYQYHNGHLTNNNVGLYSEVTKPLRLTSLFELITGIERLSAAQNKSSGIMTIEKHPSLHDRHTGSSFAKKSPLSTRLSSLSGLRDHTISRTMSVPRSSYDSSYSYEETRSTKPAFPPSHSFSSSSLKRDSGHVRKSLGQDSIHSSSPLHSNLSASSEISPDHRAVYRQGSTLGTYISLPRNEEITFPGGSGYLDRKSQLSPSISSFSPSAASSIFDSHHTPTNGFDSSPKNRFHREDHMRSDFYRRSTTKTSKSLHSPSSVSSSSNTPREAAHPSDAATRFRIKSADVKPMTSPRLSTSGYVRLEQHRDAKGKPLPHGPVSPRSDLSSLRGEETLTTGLAKLRPEESAVATVHTPPPYPVDAVNATSFYPDDVDYVHTYNKYNEMRHVSFIDYEVTTVYNDNDDVGSSHASTINSAPSTAPPVFHLLRKSDVHAARVEAPTTDQLKVDIYSVGVIIDSKMTGTFDPDKLKVEAVAPTGRVIRITGDGHYAAPFNSDEIGRWKVSMYYDGRYMDGCPIDVCDPSQVKIRDLQGGHVGKPNVFHVDCTQAGPGDLGVDVSLNGRPVSTHISPTSTSGYFKVNFTPFSPGPYEVNVHFNRAESGGQRLVSYEVNVHFNRAEVREGDVTFFDPDERQRKAVFIVRVDPKPDHVEVKASCDWEVDYITGKPFICHVTDATDISVYGMEDGTVCAHPELIADCTRVGEGDLTAEVTHNGRRFPCKVRKDRPCVYRVSFKPRGPGTYTIWVYYDGRPVKGSPFIQEIAELEKPTAHGDGLYRGVPGKPAIFTVDPRGFPGQVSVAVSGPSKPVSSQLEPQPDSTIKATYFPSERGPHTVHVKLDGKNIDGSPYHPLIVDPVNVRVSGGWRPYLDEKGLIPLKVNKEKHLPFDVSQAGPGELTSEIQGPNGKIPVTIDARNDGKHSVIFTPREEGKHYIHVNWGGYPLQNSPYMGYASHAPDEEDEFPNVRLVPISLHSPTHPASPRIPNGESFVDGPAPISRGVYSPVPQSQVEMTPTPMPGYQEYPPSSPRSVSVRSINSQPLSPNGPQKVVLSGRGLKEAEVNVPAVFQVDGTQANPGKPQSYLQGVRDQLPVSVENVRPQVYKCTYIPERPGAYLLYVNWNDKPLKGSPYKVAIREPARPHQVMATLGKPNAVLGEDLEMRIDPRNAGPGQLTVRCTDPYGMDVPCRVAENYDGTKSLKITPTMPGRYHVDIQYDGTHIMGSPYAIDIKAANSGLLPVKCWGPGIENGIIPNFHSTFWVETTGAGAGDLRVRIMGPKGAFHVKMRKASQRDKIYQCFYDPIEPGIYTVHVQWSGVHVAGSPFQVLLATSENELERMQEVLNEGGTNSIINGNYNNHHHNNSFHLNSSRSDLDNDVPMRRSRDSRTSSSRPNTSAGRDIHAEDLNDILY